MTRVLWLSPEVPEPGGSGGAIRAYHLLAGLCRRGLQPVVVAPTYADQRGRAQATAGLGVELRLVDRPHAQVREAFGAHLRHPTLAASLVTRPWLGWQADVFWAEIADEVGAVLRDGVQAAVIEHDFCARWALRLPAALPVGLAAQNATWVQLARDAEAAGGVRGRLLALEAARFRRLMHTAAPRYSWWSAVSEGDAAALGTMGANAVHLAPNGADIAAVDGVPVGAGEPGRLLFCGTLHYPPNADAVRWLIGDILPRIRMRAPSARLSVIGRGAPPDIVRLAAGDPAVEMLGWVDDLRPHFARAAVALAPLRSGGGTRLKVVEALGAGCAMVATTIGAEGVDVEDGVHLRIADGPDAFAHAVLELLDDPPAQARLGAAGRERVRDRYDWSAIADGFATSLAGFAEQGR